MAYVPEIYDSLSAVSANIGDLYLDIVMITEESPDANRDYVYLVNLLCFSAVMYTAMYGYKGMLTYI